MEFSGSFYAPELDATYRFALVDGGLVVRIEQEPPLVVAPVADDQFEISFHPAGWSGPDSQHRCNSPVQHVWLGDPNTNS